MQAIRVRRTVESQQLDIPELLPLIGKAVEIIVIEDSETPAPQGRKGPQPGTAKGMVHMSPNFDEPLEDFKPYME